MEESDLAVAKRLYLDLEKFRSLVRVEKRYEFQRELDSLYSKMASLAVFLFKEIKDLEAEVESLKNPTQSKKGNKSFPIPEGYVTFNRYCEIHRGDHLFHDDLPKCPKISYLTHMCQHNSVLFDLKKKIGRYFYIPEKEVFEYMKSEGCMSRYPLIASKQYKAQKGSNKKFS